MYFSSVVIALAGMKPECSVPSILRPPIQPVSCDLKLMAVLKWRDIDMGIENIIVVSLMDDLKIREIVKLDLEGSLITGIPLSHC